MTDRTPTATELLALTTEVVSAHVGNNAVSPGDVPALIKAVHDALLESSGLGVQEEPRPDPAVPIKKSVHSDYLICLEDGKKQKMLKRHLLTAHGMTPDEYREKWSLGRDYPMVAPSYAQQRSELATKIGLGKRSRTSPQKKGSVGKRRSPRTKKAEA